MSRELTPYEAETLLDKMTLIAATIAEWQAEQKTE